MNKIDRTKIALPKVTCSAIALRQLDLLVENDFTLSGKFLRVAISGKGCDGFTYSIGFTPKLVDDFEIRLITPQNSMNLLMDPFVAFYLQDCFIDYLQDLESDNEGFTVKNNKAELYHGKFWKEDQEKIPPMLYTPHV